MVKASVEFEEDTLREQLVEYFEDHPYAHDGCTHLRTFIAAARDPSVPVATADTELADDDDNFIELVEDIDTRLQLRWCKYLERMRSTAWGDHVAVQGLADLLQVDIDILATRDPDMEPVKSHHHPAKAVLHLGLIGQSHYVSLDAVTIQQSMLTCTLYPSHKREKKNKTKMKLHFTIKLSLEDCRMIL